MATFRTYAEALRPDHPMAKIHKAALTWRPRRYRPAGMDRDMRAEPVRSLRTCSSGLVAPMRPRSA
jgi:hypothetical protein